jgi:hypothetical protein
MPSRLEMSPLISHETYDRDLLVIRSQKFTERLQFPSSIEPIEKTYFSFGGQNSFYDPLTVRNYPSTVG